MFPLILLFIAMAAFVGIESYAAAAPWRRTRCYRRELGLVVVSVMAFLIILSIVVDTL